MGRNTNPNLRTVPTMIGMPPVRERMRSPTPPPVPLEIVREPELDFTQYARRLTQLRFSQVFPFFFLVGEDERIKPRTTVRTAVVDVGTLPRIEAPPLVDDAQMKRPLVLPVDGVQVGSAAARLSVGRHSGCDVVIDDALVSRVHAHIELRRELAVICDEGSSNGTFLDGHRLVPGQKTLLVPGARLRFGALELSFFGASEAWTWLRTRR
jgi:hypothetical protein